MSFINIHPIIRLEDSDIDLDYVSLNVEQKIIPIWSDGTLDGSGFVKIIGHVKEKSLGKLSLTDGRAVYFSRIDRTQIEFNTIYIIKQPYSIT